MIIEGEREQGLRRQLDALGDRAVAGWKVGLTSGAGRDGMGTGFRPFGFILPERVFEGGARIKAKVGLENELCFEIGKTLQGAVTRDAVMDAVATVAPGFELNERRLDASATTADRLADNLAQWGIVVGAPRRLDWSSFDFDAIRVALSHDGEVVETVAAHGHIDDHFESIRALVATLAHFDRALNEGDRVITGSYTRLGKPAPGMYTGDFGADIGSVRVEFDQT